MKKNFLVLISVLLIGISSFAAKKYYIKNDKNYDLQFLCFNEKKCYNLTPNIINIKNKKFVGFGGYHYFDISTYKYNKNTHIFSVDVLVDRDPSTDLCVCNKSPFDRGNITHLIFSLKYNPLTKDFKATYKGFVSSEDIVKYENSKPTSIQINYLNIYYDKNSEYINDLSDRLKFFNVEIAKTIGKPNNYGYDVEFEYIIPYYIIITKMRNFDNYEPVAKTLQDKYIKRIPQNVIDNYQMDMNKALKHVLYDKITYNHKTLEQMLLDFNQKADNIYYKCLKNPDKKQSKIFVEQLKEMNGTISLYPDTIIEQIQPYIEKYKLGLEPSAESDIFLYKYYIEKYNLKYSKDFRNLLNLKEYLYTKIDMYLSIVSNKT